MGKRGPKKTSKEILKLRGSWRGDLPEKEVMIEPKQVRCPRWISNEAKKEWSKISPILNKHGLLNELTVHFWTFFAICMADLKDVQAQIEKLMSGGAKTGLFSAAANLTKVQTINLRRLILIRTDLMKQLTTILKDSGVSPELIKPPPRDNPKSRFFKPRDNKPPGPYAKPPIPELEEDCEDGPPNVA